MSEPTTTQEARGLRNHQAATPITWFTASDRSVARLTSRELFDMETSSEWPIAHQQAFANRAASTTDEGVAAARAAGLTAVGNTVESDDGAWRTVTSTARAHGASLTAIRTGRLGAARSALLGSVASGIVQNAELPVLVVPDKPTGTAAREHTGRARIDPTG